MPRFEKQQKQFPSFIDPEQSFTQFRNRLVEVNLQADSKNYLTPEQIIKRLVTEISDASDQGPNPKTETSDETSQKPNRSNILIKEYFIGDNISTITLEIQYQNQVLSETIQPISKIGDHTISFLLASFRILRKAINAPQKITYEPNAKETIINEENSDDLHITISPANTNPLILLLIDIHKCYQKDKEDWEDSSYYKDLSKLLKDFEKNANIDNTEILLDRIKKILHFLSDQVTGLYEKNTIKSRIVSFFSFFKCPILCCRPATPVTAIIPTIDKEIEEDDKVSKHEDIEPTIIEKDEKHHSPEEEARQLDEKHHSPEEKARQLVEYWTRCEEEMNNRKASSQLPLTGTQTTTLNP